MIHFWSSLQFALLPFATLNHWFDFVWPTTFKISSYVTMILNLIFFNIWESYFFVKFHNDKTPTIFQYHVRMIWWWPHPNSTKGVLMSLIDHKELSLLAAAVQGGQHSVKFVEITIFRHWIVIEFDLKWFTSTYISCSGLKLYWKFL